MDDPGTCSGYAVRPSSRTVHGLIDLIVSIPFWDQLSWARRSRTACSEGAEIACRIWRSSSLNRKLDLHESPEQNRRVLAVLTYLRST